MHTDTQKPWNWMLFQFSSVKASPYSIYAASVGNGVYEIDSRCNWSRLSPGLPEELHIHRLQLQHEVLHACTNKGLYEWMGEHWENAGIALPCYQYRKISGIGYAATDNGLWMRQGSKWSQLSCEGKYVYDFMNLPQYLIVGHHTGISLYDRFMDEWAQFELKRRATSLAVYRGHLIASSERGELLVGDKQGRFDRIRFGKIFIYSVAAKGREVYVCTNCGLFKLSYIADRLTLLSVKLGFSVTDVDIHEEELHMATLFEGIQSVKL